MTRREVGLFPAGNLSQPKNGQINLSTTSNYKLSVWRGISERVFRWYNIAFNLYAPSTSASGRLEVTKIKKWQSQAVGCLVCADMSGTWRSMQDVPLWTDISKNGNEDNLVMHITNGVQDQLGSKQRWQMNKRGKAQEKADFGMQTQVKAESE